MKARFSLYFTCGHCRFGISGHGSQFMSTQKLCNRRRYTLVETVPACITCNNKSPGVSMMTRLSRGANALSLAAGFPTVLVGLLFGGQQ